MEQLRRRLAVLSSPERMELCRHLIGEPITTPDLALRMDTSAPQVSRMLAQFRDADLLTSSRDGKVARMRLDLLDITEPHTLLAGSLAWEHRDPVDRMVVAQACLDGRVVLSKDPRFSDTAISRIASAIW